MCFFLEQLYLRIFWLVHNKLHASIHSYNYDHQSQKSFHDFIQNCATDEDLTNVVIPAIEKAALRSPEVSLDGTFVAAYTYTGQIMLTLLLQKHNIWLLKLKLVKRP